MKPWRWALSTGLAIALAIPATALAETPSPADDAYERGRIAYQAGRLAEAVGWVEQYVAAAQAANDEPAVLKGLLAMATVRRELKDLNGIEALYERAIPIARKLGDQASLGEALDWLGEALQDRGDRARATTCFQEALVALKAIAPGMRRAAVHYKLANLYVAANRQQDALAEYRQARALLTGAGMEETLAGLEYTMGDAATACGAYVEAVETYRSSIARFRTMGPRPELVNALKALAHVHGTIGQLEEAIARAREAVAIARTLNDPVLLAWSCSALGNAMSGGRLHAEAIAAQEEANRLFRELKQMADLSLGLRKVALYKLAMGDAPGSVATYNEALAILESELGHMDEEAANRTIIEGLLTQGMLSHKVGKVKDAIRYYTEGIQYVRKLGNPVYLATALHGLGLLQHQGGQHKDATATLQEAVGTYDRIRAAATGDTRRDYLGQQIVAYQLLVSSLAHQSRVRDAITVSEGARARQLAESLGQADGQEARTDLMALQRGLQPDEAVLILMPAGPREALGLMVTAKGYFAQWEPIQGTQDAPMPASASPVGQRGVAPVSDETRPEEVLKDGVPALVAAYRARLANPELADGPEARAFGHALYDLYVRPHEGRLAAVKRLTVIQDGALGLVPLEALTDDQGRYMVERLDITYAHSLGVRGLLAKRAQARPAAPKPLLALGGGIYAPERYDQDVRAAVAGLKHPAIRAAFGGKPAPRAGETAVLAGLRTRGLGAFGNLPGTLAEVDAIALATPGAEALVGPAATKAQLLIRRLSDYRVLHFATHGVADFEHPDRSGLLLSVGPKDEDTLLSAKEVAGLTLSADFVCLSACQTGVGKVVGGEGVVGLSQAFLQAGASGLAMSLWSVDDAGTAAFMSGLYAGGRVPDGRAIAGLKRRMLAGKLGPYRSPYFWAPFIYHGR